MAIRDILILPVRERLYVYRGQILTSRDCPCAERINMFETLKIIFLIILTVNHFLLFILTMQHLGVFFSIVICPYTLIILWAVFT